MDHILNSKKTINSWMITNLQVTIFTFEMTNSQVILYSVFGQFSSQIITPVMFISTEKNKVRRCHSLFRKCFDKCLCVSISIN